MPAAAIIGSAVIGGASSIISGNKAAGAQENAAAMSVAEQRRQYDTTREDYRPYREVGYKALDRLSQMYLGGGGGAASGSSDGGFETSPGYKFRVDEATKAIERSAAARGALRSGATMDALQRRVQGVASDEYENFANRLSSLAGIGQQATGSTAAAGSNMANNVSNAYTNAGNARASAYQNTGNAINQGVQNVTSAYLYGKGYGTAGSGAPGGGWGSSTSWPQGIY